MQRGRLVPIAHRACFCGGHCPLMIATGHSFSLYPSFFLSPLFLFFSCYLPACMAPAGCASREPRHPDLHQQDGRGGKGAAGGPEAARRKPRVGQHCAQLLLPSAHQQRQLQVGGGQAAQADLAELTGQSCAKAIERMWGRGDARKLLAAAECATTHVCCLHLRPALILLTRPPNES